MKVFVYSTDKPVPFSEPYKKLIKEIIISNDKQYIDKFVESKDRLMRIVSEEAVCFVPVVVGDTFLGWLREKKYTLEKLTTSALPACEILGNDEFNNWFKNSVNVEEEWEDIKVSSLQSTTVKYEDSAVKVETTTEEVVEPRVYSCPESMIALMAFFYDGMLRLLLALKTFIFQPVLGAITVVVVLVVVLPITLIGLQRHQVNHQVSLVKSQWEEGKFEDACKEIKQFDTVESRTISMACKEREKAMERKIEDEGQYDNAINITEKCYEVKGGEGFSIVTQNTGVSEESIRQKNDYVWDGKNKKCKKWEPSSKIGKGWWLIIPSTNPSLKDCPDDVKKAKLKCQL